ncbi:TetR/AcrR family transcriptional regulator [Actinotalea sp. K2]|uniref:TetR/AcrR family transcriptional regulator n=1 Tax=Actinotalea sp. K2 TaxID=2939438 RepID=UPI0020170A67|nr:TetR/AcrR family transcriptional regulator [Actinotalea sp. K2]MCL3859530.1 TetR/AcrR family transcriptional regulator [Actinotalea sp. K2]
MTSTGTKGDRTREAILARAVDVACRVGLGGLTIGDLASHTGLSKSGLYAHFGSKEALQLAVVDAAAQEFTAAVVLPALRAPRGHERVLALLEAWLACGRERLPGGCLFVKASTELDEQPGPVREHLAEQHRELARTIARIFSSGVGEGQVRPDADPTQFAVDLYGVMLAYYHSHRLLADPRAQDRARAAVVALLDAARPEGHGAPPPDGLDPTSRPAPTSHPDPLPTGATR